MIDINTEQLVPFPEVPKLIPRSTSGRLVHYSAVFRWASKGLRGVTLEWVQVGGRRCTSREALQRFFERLSGETPQTTSAPTIRQRERAIARAHAELSAAGI